jgi:hypothetical protein
MARDLTQSAIGTFGTSDSISWEKEPKQLADQLKFERAQEVALTSKRGSSHASESSRLRSQGRSRLSNCRRRDRPFSRVPARYGLLPDEGMPWRGRLPRSLASLEVRAARQSQGCQGAKGESDPPDGLEHVRLLLLSAPVSWGL